MADASALIPVVMGVGLATLTANHASGSSPHREDPGRAAAMFTMAVQLIGWALVGAALYIVAWSVERGRPIDPRDLNVENWFIAALALLMVIVIIRNAWSGFTCPSVDSPWDTGLLERANAVVTFALGVTLMVLIGMCFDEALVVIGDSTTMVDAPIIVTAVLFLLVFGLAAFVVRYVLGANPSLRAVTASRRQQQRLVQELGDASGSWVSISVRAIGELEPNLALAAVVWATDRGWYWRPDDAYALARYHSWAGSHARVPVAALHSQRVSVVAGKFKDSIRGMRITSTTRRLWFLDAWQTHHSELPLVCDAGSPERRAALVHIAYEQLQAAGLAVTVRPERGPAPVVSPPAPLAPAVARGTRETTSLGR